MTPESKSVVQQARQAIHAGRTQEARHLLQQAVRQDPHDYTTWLWLASVASSPQASLEYVQRAEMLQPHDPTVQKALAWAQRRVATAAKTAVIPPPTHPSNGRSRQWSGWLTGNAVTLLLLLLIIGLLSVVLGNQLGLGLQSRSITANPTVAAVAVLQTMPAPSPAPATAAPETMPDRGESAALNGRSLAKNIGSPNQPRKYWTPTPLPTHTPEPTATPVPTFISETQVNGWVGQRPFGVADTEPWIDINLTNQTLTAYEGDALVFNALISSGTWNHPTVTGQFRTWIKYESQTMDGRLLGYDYYLEGVPYVMYFYQDYAIHGTYWHNNFGTPMSHGCVNMQTDEAGWLFSWAPVGTVVNVHY